MPRNVRARPDTTWSARRWIVITPCSRLRAPPASIATITPSHGFPVDAATAKPATRTHQHHPLDAQVQDAGPLGKDLADGREQHDGAAGDARGQDRRPVHQVATIGRAKRMR